MESAKLYAHLTRRKVVLASREALHTINELEVVFLSKFPPDNNLMECLFQIGLSTGQLVGMFYSQDLSDLRRQCLFRAVYTYTGPSTGSRWLDIQPTVPISCENDSVVI